ncbi:unnamed protein product [Nesidiocoris tenuis]|uniref:Uncharacterized protein n=1 Tax=Nesidiocoris tenuis TaxID=355587 RepID=A0A6H5HSP3_9HEMI|nr:unnamed protein product [Nesidiocoris tenuis]
MTSRIDRDGLRLGRKETPPAVPPETGEVSLSPSSFGRRRTHGLDWWTRRDRSFQAEDLYHRELSNPAYKINPQTQLNISPHKLNSQIQLKTSASRAKNIKYFCKFYNARIVNREFKAAKMRLTAARRGSDRAALSRIERGRSRSSRREAFVSAAKCDAGTRLSGRLISNRHLTLRGIHSKSRSGPFQ